MLLRASLALCCIALVSCGGERSSVRQPARKLTVLTASGVDNFASAKPCAHYIRLLRRRIPSTSGQRKFELQVTLQHYQQAYRKARRARCLDPFQ